MVIWVVTMAAATMLTSFLSRVTKPKVFRPDSGRQMQGASGQYKAMVRARHGWPYWLAFCFMCIISAGCAWAATMLVLDSSSSHAFAYWIIFILTLPFALIQAGFVLVYRSDRVLQADDRGVRLYHGDNLGIDFEWSQVLEFRLGDLPVASKYHGVVQRGYRIEVVGRNRGRTRKITLDSIRWDVPTHDLVAFAEEASLIAQSHAVLVTRLP